MKARTESEESVHESIPQGLPILFPRRCQKAGSLAAHLCEVMGKGSRGGAWMVPWHHNAMAWRTAGPERPCPHLPGSESCPFRGLRPPPSLAWLPLSCPARSQRALPSLRQLASRPESLYAKRESPVTALWLQHHIRSFPKPLRAVSTRQRARSRLAAHSCVVSQLSGTTAASSLTSPRTHEEDRDLGVAQRGDNTLRRRSGRGTAPNLSPAGTIDVRVGA